MVTRARSNALPEGMEYPDTGCHVSPSCLACPLARCVFERARLDQRIAVTEVLLARCREGETVASLAESAGVSVRTVYRARSRE